MTYAAPVLFTILLICSLPAMTLVAASPTAQQPDAELSTSVQPSATSSVDHHDDTTSRLGLAGPTEHAYTSTGPDFGSVLASNGDELRYEWKTFETEYRWTERPPSEREEILDDIHANLSTQMTELDARAQAVTQQANDGEVTANQYLRSQVRIDRESKILTDQFLHIYESLAHDLPSYYRPVRDEVRTLEVYQGPVSDLLWDEMSGVEQDREPRHVSVEISADGSIVGTLDGGQYVREASRYDNRDLSRPNQLDDQDKVANRVAEIYPWLQDATTFGGGGYNFHYDINLIRFVEFHEQGNLWAYLDGGTEDIFYETQELRLSDLPTTTTSETWENESLELTMNETPHTGPIELTATDTDTDEPVDVRVSIDDYYLGDTGEDGTIWVLPPPGEFELTLEAPDRTVTTTVGG